LNDAPVNGFGVGGAISNAPAIDFAMDIVSMKIDDAWKPVAKRGKFSGKKEVWKCPSCARTYVTRLEKKAPKCHKCDLTTRRVSVELVKNGEIIKPPEKPNQIRKYVLEQLAEVGEDE
jgi:nicotinate phosphoribosyltransferase